MLCIQDLHATVQDTPILHGVSLQIAPGEVHAIMGPNGSGKSTLSNIVAGHPSYTVTAGSITYNGVDLLELEADKRALLGIFLAFQYPKEIAGVSMRNFLFAAYSAHMQARFPDSQIISPIKFKKLLIETMESLKMDPSFADRTLNKGFSGGEKKKAEILQMKLLKPTLALLDETDSGLDIDALQIVARHVTSARGPHFSALIITHYARLLEFITPDYVHIMIKGTIVKSGTAALAMELERNGYKEYV